MVVVCAMMFGLKTVMLTKDRRQRRFSLRVTDMDKIRNEYVRGTN